MTLDALHAATGALFVPAHGGGSLLRTGVEVEVIPVRTASGAVALPEGVDGEAGTLPVLRSLARDQGWREEPMPYGVPRFHLADGALLSYEPGGQLEYSSAPHARLETLDSVLTGTFDVLAAAMLQRGIQLLARGVDPHNPLATAQMVVHGERYRRQRAHYDRKGPAGGAMMLQSAGLHLNLDFGAEPLVAWEAANTITPLLIAIFANSAERADTPGCRRSERAALWRTLDASRNTVFAPADDAVQDYLDFALAAESFLLGDIEAPPRTFGEHMRLGTGTGDLPGDFARHLTTLFPEVRPRGYLEIRSVDTLPPHWCIVPAAMANALVHHHPTREAVRREIPPASEERLRRAGESGIGDAALAAEAQWIMPRVLEGLHGLGTHRSVVERVSAWFAEFTSQGADAGGPAVRPSPAS